MSKLPEQEPYRWERWRGYFCYYAKATIIIDCDDLNLPPVELDDTLHFMGVNMGYSVKAWSLAGLERKIKRFNRKAHGRK